MRQERDPGTFCIYVHCANGHGRSGLFAGMMLVVMGVCGDLDAAKGRMRLKRSVINWQVRTKIVLKSQYIGPYWKTWTHYW